MATRATVSFIENEKTFCKVYKHWDGYIFNGFGQQLIAYLSTFEGVSNGNMKGYANGLSCLAAFVVAHFKESEGDVRLIGADENWGEEYEYFIKEENSDIMIAIDQSAFKPVKDVMAKIKEISSKTSNRYAESESWDQKLYDFLNAE